jgi:hypothetical protein
MRKALVRLLAVSDVAAVLPCHLLDVETLTPGYSLGFEGEASESIAEGFE